MSEIRLIKKYPNRRLYDTAISSYITLDDIKELVLNCIEFKVIDARSQEDLTHITLLQIISEQEESGRPIFTNQLLQDLIRYYGNSMQGVMGSFLEQGLKMFTEQQQTMTEKMGNLFPASPLNLINDMTQRNLAIWQSLQQSFLSVMTGSAPTTNPPKEEMPPEEPKPRSSGRKK